MDQISPIVPILGFAAVSYLLGGIPTGPWVARGAGIDLSRVGSGNVGATNVYRALGLQWALIVFAGDALKGALPALAASWWLGPGPAEWAAALGAVAGHVFNPYLKFKGGKGVATGFGAMLGLSPWAALSALALWIVIMAAKRVVSLASLAAALSLPVFTWVFGTGKPHRLSEVTAAGAIVILVVASHRENIARIAAGAEKQIRREESSPAADDEVRSGD